MLCIYGDNKQGGIMKDWMVKKALALDVVFREFKTIEYWSWAAMALVAFLTITYQHIIFKLYNMEIFNQYIFKDIIASNIDIIRYGQLLLPLIVGLTCYLLICEKYESLVDKKYRRYWWK